MIRFTDKNHQNEEYGWELQKQHMTLEEMQEYGEKWGSLLDTPEESDDWDTTEYDGEIPF
jgi:hypothetical protein